MGILCCLSLPLTATDASDAKLNKKTPEEVWQEVLDAEQYRILREKGTEAPGSGKYNKFFEDGVYKCAGCNLPLYKSETKFDSGSGWPAFYAEIPGTVDRHVDYTFGMKRTEITCRNCGGHLGHVFEGEHFKTPTDMRHCVNSACLAFQPSNGKQLEKGSCDVGYAMPNNAHGGLFRKLA